MTIDQILDDFEVLDSWDDRYRYLIELGRKLVPLPAAARSEANKVQGCASQVWLVSNAHPAKSGSGPVLEFLGDSDAHIVRGLVAVVLAMFSGKSAAEIAAIDAEAVFARLDLRAHLSQQRSNGLHAMVARIKAEAKAALAAAS